MTVTPDAVTEIAPSEASTPVIEIFKDVPNFDARTLVLKYGEKLVDLKFCSCPNKYKKRFASFLNDNTELYESIRQYALSMTANGYKVDVKEILDTLRTSAKVSVKAAEYLKTYPHDFELDKIERDYLIRKLMMEEAALLDAFDLEPVKCRSNCGYPGETEIEEEPATSLAGF